MKRSGDVELSLFGLWFLLVAAAGWSVAALTWLIIPGHNFMAAGALCGAVGCSVVLAMALRGRGGQS